MSRDNSKASSTREGSRRCTNQIDRSRYLQYPRDEEHGGCVQPRSREPAVFFRRASTPDQVLRWLVGEGESFSNEPGESGASGRAGTSEPSTMHAMRSTTYVKRLSGFESHSRYAGSKPQSRLSCDLLRKLENGLERAQLYCGKPTPVYRHKRTSAVRRQGIIVPEMR